MNFTFGIVTGGDSDHIKDCIQSIHNLKIPNYEIIVVGKNLNINSFNTRFVQYNDIHPSGDISIKKNIITNISNYNNIVYLHDYISFSLDWYRGFLDYGNEFDICMTRILNSDNTRYRDWSLWAEDGNPILNNNHYLIPYDMTHLSKLMYFSGAYWIGKKSFMLDNPLDNRLPWGYGEDVEWSKRVRTKTDFKMNRCSSVKLLKYKDRVFDETTLKENIFLYNLKL